MVSPSSSHSAGSKAWFLVSTASTPSTVSAAHPKNAGTTASERASTGLPIFISFIFFSPNFFLLRDMTSLLPFVFGVVFVMIFVLMTGLVLDLEFHRRFWSTRHSPKLNAKTEVVRFDISARLQTTATVQEVELLRGGEASKVPTPHRWTAP